MAHIYTYPKPRSLPTFDCGHLKDKQVEAINYVSAHDNETLPSCINRVLFVLLCFLREVFCSWGFGKHNSSNTPALKQIAQQCLELSKEHSHSGTGWVSLLHLASQKFAVFSSSWFTSVDEICSFVEEIRLLQAICFSNNTSTVNDYVNIYIHM